MEVHTRKGLLEDLAEITKRKPGYIFTAKEAFVLGYLSGKYGLERLIDNKDAVVTACDQYDETDDLALLDTIAETLIDLSVIDPFTKPAAS